MRSCIDRTFDLSEVRDAFGYLGASGISGDREAGGGEELRDGADDFAVLSFSGSESRSQGTTDGWVRASSSRGPSVQPSAIRSLIQRSCSTSASRSTSVAVSDAGAS